MIKTELAIMVKEEIHNSGKGNAFWVLTRLWNDVKYAMQEKMYVATATPEFTVDN